MDPRPELARNARVFADWLGVKIGAGMVLAYLHAHPDKSFSLAGLGETLRLHASSVKIYVSDLRAAMEPEAIWSEYGVRNQVHFALYQIGDEGLVECEAALADANRRGAR